MTGFDVPGMLTVAGDHVVTAVPNEDGLYVGDDLYVEMASDTTVTPVVCLCSHEGGGENGWLVGDAPFGPLTEGVGRWGTNRDTDKGGDDWGCLHYIHQKLKNAGKTWHAGYEDEEDNPAGIVRFNDISKMHGGEFGHSSQENGLDVDIEYVYEYEKNELGNFEKGGIDFVASNGLIAQFLVDGDVTDIFIGTWIDLDVVDRVSRKTEAHQDHFHVRYRDPDPD